MITTKKQLKDVLKEEKDFYLRKGSVLENIVVSDNCCKIYRFVKLLRKTEYHYNNRSNIFHKILYAWYRRRKNIAGRRLGIEMWENTFDRGLKVWHAGNIVINGHARVGKNCILHGDNCIGNNGKSFACPKLGDNVRIGVGAKIIGDVELANDVTVAAGAVVIESCLTEHAVLAGVPAKCVKISCE